MSFLLEALSQNSNPEAVKTAFADYRVYLESVREKLPAFAYEFAAAPWHYDYRDHRCPHDAWVESLLVQEPSSGTRHEIRETEAAIKLLGAYHDGYLELIYPGVRSYSLFGEFSRKPNIGHGDWLTDEIRLSDNNFVLHEILFSTGSRWLIESRDIEVRWTPHS